MMPNLAIVIAKVYTRMNGKGTGPFGLDGTCLEGEAESFAGRQLTPRGGGQYVQYADHFSATAG